MDRQTIYYGQIPLETDLLHAQQNGMVALAKLCAGVLGQTSIVNGFQCTPTTPASLAVILTAGEVYQVENLEATAWSSLPANLVNSIVKQGILLSPIQFGITPPGTLGYSQVSLVEVQYQDLDSGLVTLPYFNAANPSSPFMGPGNSGQAQNTVRQGIVAAQIKAGLAAPTGSQIAPSPDAGYVGLFTVTVAYGATSITAGNIVQLATAPFIPATLPAVPGDVQDNAWTYCQDTGAVNAMVGTVFPIPLALVPGLAVRVKAANANTGAATFNLNNLGAAPIHRANGAALSSGDYAVGQVLDLIYDGAAWQISNYFGFTSSTTNNNTYVLSIPYTTDIGAVNAYAGTYTPAITGPSAGQPAMLRLANSNTGASTFNPNGLGAAPIVLPGNIPVTAGTMLGGGIAFMVFDGTSWELMDNMFWPNLTANVTYYVNGASGSDSNNGFTPATAWQTIQHAVNVVAGLNLNGFTVTIQVADWVGHTYGQVILPKLGGVGNVRIVGNTTTPANVTVGGALGPAFMNGSQGVTGYQLGGMKVNSLGTTATNWPGCGLWITDGGAIQIYDMELGSCPSANLMAVDALIQILGADSPLGSGYLNIVGGGQAAFFVESAGQIQFDGPTINFNAAVSYSLATAYATSQGNLRAYTVVFTGAGNVSGVRYNSSGLGCINTFGGGPNYFPGTSAGVTSTSGIYI